MQPTSQKLDAIDSWLQKMLDRFPQKGTLTTSEIEDWHRDLAPFSLGAIDAAFDAHRRNALFFPVAGQILDLCIAFAPPDEKSTSTCDAACKKTHWTGYGWDDVKWLLLRLAGERPMHFQNGNARFDPLLLQARALAGAHAESVVVERGGKDAGVADWGKLFDELDRVRHDGAPAWRKSSEV